MVKEEVIAMCGLVCSDCPAYVAMKKDDPALRKKTAEAWSKMFNSTIKPEDIFCVGCAVKKGKHIGHCAECQMRLCGLKKNVKNCAYCPDYACEILLGFFKMVPDAKIKLDNIKSKL